MSLIPKIADQPLMITPDYVDALASADIDTLEKKAKNYVRQTSSQGITDEKIAIIPVSGPLSHKSDFWSFLFGGTSYEEIRQAFRAALEDSRVETIVFVIDSPGGEVAGLFDLVDEIYSARGIKSIYAVVNEMAYSAAYAIASAASEIYIPRTGGVGSIGVIAIHIDQSRYDENLGLKYTPIYSGARKNDFSAHKPLSDAAYDVVKAEIDEVYTILIDTVARNRKMDPGKIRNMEAGIYQGQKAVESGLADGIMSFDEVLKIKRGGNIIMTLFEKLTEALKDAKPDDITKAMGELGYVSKEGMLSKEEHEAALTEKAKEFDAKLADAITTATAEGKDTAKKEAIAVLELCSVGSMEKLGLQLVSDGATVEDARKKILETKAANSKDGIISTVHPLKTGEISPLIADAERRAKEVEANGRTE
jgi:signal peptide peptidase SppA